MTIHHQITRSAERMDYVKHRTAPYRYLREIHFADELPKTISGKIPCRDYAANSARDGSTTKPALRG